MTVNLERWFPKALRRYQAIPKPETDIDSVATAVVALKDAFEVLSRQADDTLNSAVTVQDLLNLPFAKLLDESVVASEKFYSQLSTTSQDVYALTASTHSTIDNYDELLETTATSADQVAGTIPLTERGIYQITVNMDFITVGPGGGYNVGLRAMLDGVDVGPIASGDAKKDSIGVVAFIHAIEVQTAGDLSIALWSAETGVTVTIERVSFIVERVDG